VLWSDFRSLRALCLDQHSRPDRLSLGSRTQNASHCSPSDSFSLCACSQWAARTDPLSPMLGTRTQITSPAPLLMFASCCSVWLNQRVLIAASPADAYQKCTVACVSVRLVPSRRPGQRTQRSKRLTVWVRVLNCPLLQNPMRSRTCEPLSPDLDLLLCWVRVPKHSLLPLPASILAAQKV
jgi:hypothetical protein